MKELPNGSKNRLSAFAFQDYIPFLLNATTGRFLDRDKLDPRGMPLPSWRVLAVLSNSEAMNFGMLSRLTALPLSTLSRVLNSLEAEKLVSRNTRGDDGRATSVSLTELGRREVNRILPHAKKLQKIALEGFSADEAEFFIRMLKRVYDNVEHSIRELETGER